jgi:hypothetical protein
MLIRNYGGKMKKEGIFNSIHSLAPLSPRINEPSKFGEENTE